MVMSLFTSSTFAQEVRGVETRRVIYHGEVYKLYYNTRNRNSVFFANSDEYFGFEFANRNKISVSVSIEVFYNGKEDGTLGKEIVLKPGEIYILKKPSLPRYREGSGYSDLWYDDTTAEKWEKAESNGKNYADQYYFKYKAYKLQ